MESINIQGRETLNIKNIVFDYNGTIAVDGILNEYVKKNLVELSKKFNIYILTADTYGNVQQQCRDLPIKIETFPKGNATKYKKDFVHSLDSKNTVVVGNGMNDIEMFKEAVLSVAVIGEEGCAGRLLLESDIVVKDINSAFILFQNTNRIIATLRD
ncbi:HAD family hydrolase [Clostridium niameyense]|uniref:HAD family hydrolase n=1 Tax=Clostridium niameyense TaxID=1622073 RepID=UPI00067E8A73|nr:HAD hydrolase family protein [Clostridium niameyense]